uniref:Polyketide synthase n=1 Tax=Sorangium cellulosum TaxID=56 RepID=Q9L8C6_SORCE|nr:polyketide synthase [Sorangium cellulosum]
MTDREGQLLERLREVTLALRKTLNERDTLELEKTEPIAIVGIGCRFPGGAGTPEAFWELLDDGRDAIRPLEERWALVGVDPGDDVPRWAGLLTEAIDGFDAAFFGIAPREARSLDPQHRLLLEVAWEGFEDAGIPPRSLVGSRTGVFVGVCATEYLHAAVAHQPREERDAYSTTGNMLSIAAGRLSYTLGLQGPCLTVDTACSSSLVAIHLACRSLRARESDLALAGGVNMLLSPDTMRALARTQALSPNGRCQTFDASANGFVRGEGCGLIVLKRLSDARRDGDRIWALIRGSAINQDGRSTGLTAPNVLAQGALLREALRNAGVEAEAIGYIETHGAATSLGDPIEIEALRAVVGPARADGARCVLGAVKTNLGHLEGAAGVAGLIKATLSLHHERIPRNLNFRTLNPRIRIEGTALALATEPVPWPRTGRTRFAGVSSFGMSGTNAHVVLEEAPAVEPEAAAPERAAELFVLSAKSAAALDAQAARLRDHLEKHVELGLGDVAFSLATTRSAMEHRLAVAASSREALRGALSAAAQGHTPPGAVRGRASGGSAPKVVFVFPGQGSQWVGMGRKLMAEEPVFRAALEGCDRAIEAEAGWSLLGELSADEAASQLGRIDVVQPVLFAMEVALSALWRSWGVEPEAVVGHSMGEVAAAHVAGALSLEDAVAIICRRSRLLRRISGQGEMALVELSLEEAEAALRGHEGRLSVAVSNSPRSTVLAGEPAALSEVLAALTAKGVFWRQVKVDVASHSPQVDPLREELIAALGAIRPRAAAVPMRSTVTGGVIAGPELGASYWADNLRQPVRFAAAAQALLEGGPALFIEMSPHPILVPPLDEIQTAAEQGGAAVGSLRRGQDERATLLEALGTLWASGYPVSWARLFPAGGRRVPLPTYPWQHERCWIEVEPDARRLAAADPTKDWFYRTDWPEVPRAAPKSETAHGSWLLLADRGGVGEAVAAALSTRGLSCTVLHASADASTVAEQVSEAASRRNDWQGVLYLWGLDAVVDAGASADEVSEATRRATAPVLGLVRFLSAAPHPPRFWVVTRGACTVGGEPEASLCQAALWGLARVAALEHPAAWGGLVDLDPQKSPTEIEPLVAELLSPDAEDQLAFRSGRRHAARLVAAPPEGDVAPISLSAEGSYLVTGGLGGLGLLVARWLVERGARHLVLTSRHGLPERQASGGEQPPEARARIAAVEGLEAQGARVTVAAVDVAEADPMTALLAAIEPPLRGVVHAAGVFPVRHLAETDEALLESVLRPKVAGSWLLHRLLRDRPLDLFVLFSSGAAVWGGKGQGAYAAANAFLDGLAHHRRAHSLPALSLAWGLWAEGGMVDAKAHARLSDIGVLPMATGPALSALERLVNTSAVQRSVTRMDWARFAPVYAARGRRNLLSALVAEDERAASPPVPTANRIWRGLSVAESRSALYELVRGIVARVLGFSDPGALDVGRGFAEQGLDSLMALEIRNRLQRELGERLSATLAFDHPTVERLVAHLLTDVLKLEDRSDTRHIRSVAADDDIAIVGAACRFPGGDEGLETYWRHLAEGMVVSTEVPADRWRAADWYDPDPEVPGRTYVAKGAFLRDVRSLDAAFFAISPREAMSLDPQQRLLLEVSWEAIERAGQDPMALRESATGVFVGMIGSEHAERVQGLDDDAALLYGTTGNLLSVAAGRLSFFLGLHGPTMTVDTACSSSLVALHLACQSLRLGECDQALAGGSSVLLSPRSFVAASRMRLLSPDGRCKTFSAAADGFARAEGCAVVVLKRLRDAQRDRDPILAVVRSTAINHDGPSSGLTVPSGPAQQALLRQALAQAGVAPAEVDFVECHGTGTALGDPIEVQALGAVYGRGRPAERPLWLGAVKANLGHLEAAAGLAGVLKVLLALEHEQIPAQPELDELNPHIPWAELPVAVVRRAVPWPRGARPRRAGVSAFGLSGTNAHVVLEEAPAVEPVAAAPERAAELFVLSAKSAAALDAQAARLRDHLEKHVELGLGDVAFSLATTRSAMEHRLAVAASSREALRGALSAAAQGHTPPGAVRGRASGGSAPKVVFVFPGQGSQWVGMGRKLMAEEPVFRAALEGCDRAIEAEAGWSLLGELSADEAASQLGRIDVVQPVLFAMEVALSALWRSWGVEPEAVVGHSMGEVAAAHVAGALSLEDAVAIICRRSRLLRRISGQGEMALVELSLEEAEAALRGHEGRLSVAVSNSPRSTVLAGEPAALSEVLAALTAKGVFWRQVKVDVASHSPQVDPLREELIAALGAIRPRAAAVPMRSTVTGGVIAGPELGASYWADNLRQPVRFAAAAQALLEGGPALFIEMSPHPILVPPLDEIQTAAEQGGAAVGSLRRGQDERATLLEALGTLWASGYPVSWARLFPAGGRRVPLPTYPWQHERYWIEDSVHGSKPSLRLRQLRNGATDHPLLGAPLLVSARPGAHLWEQALSDERLSYLSEHRVHGEAVLPSAAYVEMALAAGVDLYGTATLVLEQLALERALAVPSEGGRIVQVALSEEGPGRASFQVSSREEAGRSWVRHATGHVCSGQSSAVGALKEAPWEIQRRCPSVLSSEALYPLLNEHALDYGPCFQGVEQVWLGTGEVLGRVRLPGDMASSSGAYRIHPALLDACFQVLTALLTTPESIEIRRRLTDLHEPDLPRSRAPVNQAVSDTWLWDAALDGGRRQSASVPVDLVLGSFHAKWEVMERLAQAYIIGTLRIWNVFCAAGERHTIDELLVRLQISVVYRKVIKRWMEHLVAIGILVGDGEHFVSSQPLPEPDLAAVLEEAGRVFADLPVLFEWCKFAGERLADVLTGKTLALEILFPGGSFDMAERIYRDSPIARYSNGIVRGVVESAARVVAPSGMFSILEIGAGTGATTAAVLPVLLPDRTEYHFTDVSPLFLARAEQRFRDYPFLKYGILDVDQEPAGQGYAHQRFDVIVAANVIHATRDIRATAKRLLSLLAPGGLLVLVEGTGHPIWFDITTGLIEGWQKYEDDLRIDHPLLPARTWCDVLRRVGFADAVSLPGDGSPAGILGQHVILSRAPGIAGAACDSSGESATESPAARAVRQEWADGSADVVHRMALERMYFHRRPGRQVWVHGRLRTGGGAFTKALAGDLLLFEDTGQVVAEVQGLRLPQLEASAFAPRDPREEWLYALEWQRKDPIPEAPAAASSSSAGAWLVLMDQGGTGAALVSLLEGRGEACVRVIAGTAYACLAPGLYQVDPAQPDGFHTLLRDAFGEDRICRAVVHMWSLDATAAGERATAESLQADQLLGSLSALSLVQALVRRRWRNMPRLWLLTRAVHAVGAEDAAASVAQAPVWGLGRTLALEHPELRCTLVDVNPAPSPEDAAALAVELGASDREDQVALRSDGRYVARLVRSSFSGKPATDCGIRADGSYVITDGMGRVGLSVAQWMVMQGARHVVLVDRGGASEASRDALRSMAEAGAEVQIVEADVARRDDVARLLSKIEPSMPPLRGIVYVDGTFQGDSSMLELDARRFKEWMYPKVLGAWNLHALTRDRSLDFFVLYSSGTSLLGLPGQGSRAAGDAFLDAIAHHRCKVGLTAMSINWGLLSEASSPATPNDGGARLEYRGMEGLTLEQGAAALGRLLARPRAQVGVMRLNLRQWLEFYPNAARLALWAELLKERDRADRGASNASNLREALQSARPEDRQLILEKHLSELLGRGLRLPPERIERHVPFSNLGMDSLIGLELRNRIEAALGITVPATLLWTYPNVAALSGSLLDILFPNAGATHAPATEREKSFENDAADLEALRGMTDEQKDALLAEKLAQLAQIVGE